MTRNRLLATSCLLMLVATSGCATYSDRIDRARERVQAGDLDGAIDEMNRVLGVGSWEEFPDDWGSDRPLAILERGALLQATERPAASSRDLSAGETEIELLDFKHDTAGQIGTYIYSDSARNYEMSPTERLALNAVNMLNFLELGEWSAAAVEARRFAVMREYLDSVGLDQQGTFGSYLAGLVFERLGEGNRALRFYEEAMEKGTLASLREPVTRLAAHNPYRGPRVDALLADGARSQSGTTVPTEIVTVLSLGRVPRRVPERIPIGAAVGMAGTFITGNPDILARSLFKVVVFPDLVDSGSRARNAAVEIDGGNVSVERLSSLGADIRREYDEIRPRIIGAALTRMIARAAAAEGARVAGQQVAGPIGLLAALATEAALVSLDRPDTRSWTMLADHVLVSRSVVEPGEHIVRVRVQGLGPGTVREVPVALAEGEIAVVVVTDPR